MSIRAVLARLRRGDNPAVVVECRHCGTNLSLGAGQCPDCGSEEIARYRISE